MKKSKLISIALILLIMICGVIISFTKGDVSNNESVEDKDNTELSGKENENKEGTDLSGEKDEFIDDIEFSNEDDVVKESELSGEKEEIDEEYVYIDGEKTRRYRN